MSQYQQGTALVLDTSSLLTTSSSGNNAGIVVKNRGTVEVYLGGSSVTADDTSTGGLPVSPGEKVTVPTVGNVAAELHAVTAAGEALVSWISPN